MTKLERRLEWVKQRIGIRPRRRLIYFGPNLEENNGEETPHSVRLSSEIWAHIFGAGLSSNEAEKAKEDWYVNDPKI